MATSASPMSPQGEGAAAQVGARLRRRVWLLLALLGPGVIALLADNDAGGMVSYTVTGATLGITFLLPLLFLLAPVAYTVQEMSMRLSAVTGLEYRELILRRYGRAASTVGVSALGVANLLYTVTEFVGMTAGLRLVGLPLWAADALSLAFVSAIALGAGYRSKERLALLVAASSAVFIVVALMTHPSLAGIGAIFTQAPRVAWTFSGNGMPVFVMATVGNVIAPFMLYFQSSATLDKGLSARDLRRGRTDIAVGALLQPFFAMCVMLAGAALLGRVADPGSAGPAALIAAFGHLLGRTGALLFALGIFDAGWLAAVTLSFASSYTLSGALGWPRSLESTPRESPRFYALYFGNLLLGALIVLVPGLPLDMLAVYTQIIAAALLVPDLIWLARMTGDRSLMGAWVSGPWRRAAGWTVVSLYLTLALGAIGATVLHI